ncbi:MAG: hypothetical protein QOH58_2552 [Thermoleophilaceae bacterium]|jgi:hypothetical protein|nr:hypothetical protein [Thermoleophilaceae bacterium]
MPTEQDATETAPSLGPQTAAARRRELTPDERERLRAESRARRRAREAAEDRPPREGHPPEPQAGEISVRRMEADERGPAHATPAAGRFLVAHSAARHPIPVPEPAAPARPALPPLPRLPDDLRDRGVLLLGLACAAGAVVCLVATLASGLFGGASAGGMQGEPSRQAVAPGGWIALAGSDAPADARLVLESRSEGGRWRSFGEGESDGDGRFRLRGRVLERPGRVMLRARAPGAAAATPVAVTVRPLRLASVGDINLGDDPGAAIAANGPRYPWEDTGAALRKADLAFGNLESAVSKRGEPVPKEYNFRGTPQALAGLRRHSGIDVLNLANNHVGDYGPEATLDTIRGVQRLGMKAVGAGPNLRRALAPQVVERLGLRVAFVGFSEIAPVEFAAAEDRPGTAWADPEAIASAVQAARRRADVVVATFHWGIEKQTLETARQRELADVAVRAGAQVVVGAHPHTLQPVRRQGGAIVAYSLGNFVFGAESDETSTTGILELDLTAEGVSRARWRAARISGGRPLLDDSRPRRLPLRDSVAMEAGVNLFDL